MKKFCLFALPKISLILTVALLWGSLGVAVAGNPTEKSTPMATIGTDEEEYFVEQVEAWNGFSGEEARLNIYRTKTYDNETIYIARKVTEYGESVYGVVLPVSNPEEVYGYRHSAKVGLIGRYYFTAKRIPRSYSPSERFY